jgi:hypothetical protein
MAGASERYRRYAGECLRIAQETVDPADKARLLQMAQAWMKLADDADRRGDNSPD